MPNLVGPIVSEILVQNPMATLAERLDRGVQMRLPDAPDGRQRYALVSTIGPLHYRDGASLLEIDTDYRDSDDANFSDLADRLPYRLYAGTNGQRRLFPRREVASEYVEFGGPQYWTGSAWQNLNAGPRTRAGDTLSWDRPAFSMALSADTSGIHKTITLKTGQAARRIRWPVTLVGLTWDNWTLISSMDGAVIGRLSQPLITADGNGELETPRAVASSYINGAVEFTADVTGLSYPITIDPTVDVQVAANADDGNWQSNGTFNAAQNNNQIGNVTPPGFTSNSFARFTGVTISGTIDTSYVEVMASATGSVAVAIIIYADDEDNPAAPTSNADVAGRARTTASVSWSPGAWTSGTFYPSPSLNTIFQELVDSYTISADAVMVFLQDDASGSNLNRSIRDFTIGAASSPKLHIEYTAGGGAAVPLLTLLGVG